MIKENNVYCTRKACKANKGFFSSKLHNTGEVPVQCKQCKRYDTVKKLKK